MVAYLDTSVLLQYLLLGDQGFRQVVSCDAIISSELLEIECKRVFHRYRLQWDLDDDSLLEALKRLESVLTGVDLLLLSSSVKKRSSESFPVVVRTLDALHLSSALVYRETRPNEGIIFFSYDNQLNRCARALAFPAPFSRDT